jgi:acylphosphatase
LDDVSNDKEAWRIHISGRVQGVGYRYFALDVAERLGIAGYTANLSDGRVEVYAIGTPAQLRTLVEELRRGPRGARVEQVVQSKSDIIPAFASQFSIEHTR